MTTVYIKVLLGGCVMKILYYLFSFPLHLLSKISQYFRLAFGKKKIKKILDTRACVDYSTYIDIIKILRCFTGIVLDF